MRVDIELIPLHHWVAVLPNGERLVHQDLDTLRSMVESQNYSIGEIRR